MREPVTGDTAEPSVRRHSACGSPAAPSAVRLCSRGRLARSRARRATLPTRALIRVRVVCGSRPAGALVASSKSRTKGAERIVRDAQLRPPPSVRFCDEKSTTTHRNRFMRCTLMCGAHFRREMARRAVRFARCGDVRAPPPGRASEIGKRARAVRWGTASTLAFPECAPECFAGPLSLALSRFGRRGRLHSGTPRFRLVSARGRRGSPEVAQPCRFGLVRPLWCAWRSQLSGVRD